MKPMAPRLKWNYFSFSALSIKLNCSFDLVVLIILIFYKMTLTRFTFYKISFKIMITEFGKYGLKSCIAE